MNKWINNQTMETFEKPDGAIVTREEFWNVYGDKEVTDDRLNSIWNKKQKEMEHK